MGQTAPGSTPASQHERVDRQRPVHHAAAVAVRQPVTQLPEQALRVCLAERPLRLDAVPQGPPVCMLSDHLQRMTEVLQVAPSVLRGRGKLAGGTGAPACTP